MATPPIRDSRAIIGMIRRIVGNMAANIILPWSHRAFSLMKRWALGTYHGLRRKHVDVYLDEFVFRYNRRFHRHVSFETVLGLAAHGRPQTSDLLGHHPTRQSAQIGSSHPATTSRKT